MAPIREMLGSCFCHSKNFILINACIKFLCRTLNCLGEITSFPVQECTKIWTERSTRVIYIVFNVLNLPLRIILLICTDKYTVSDIQEEDNFFFLVQFDIFLRLVEKKRGRGTQIIWTFTVNSYFCRGCP